MSDSKVIVKPKYILIVSQFFYSRHAFVVDANMDDAEYFGKARATIGELEILKRTGSYQEGHVPKYGDFEVKYFGSTARRYNVNDAGDIYFIPCWCMSQAMANARSYWEATYRESRGYQKKSVRERIEKCHRWDEVKRIVEKQFVVL